MVAGAGPVEQVDELARRSTRSRPASVRRNTFNGKVEIESASTRTQAKASLIDQHVRHRCYRSGAGVPE